ncbi:MAG: hypothetical protein LBP91_02955 [Coriobacteriales bacterium]|nr:hypothetical protein [Coriobacteriales bacterium]
MLCLGTPVIYADGVGRCASGLIEVLPGELEAALGVLGRAPAVYSRWQNELYVG